MVTQKAAVLQQQAGQLAHTERVEVLQFDLSKLEQDGIFLEVSSTGTSVLSRRLSLQTLGITVPKEVAVNIRLPRADMLPDAYRLPIMQAVGKIYDAHTNLSFRFKVVEAVLQSTDYRFIPKAAWPAFEAEFTAAEAALATAKQRVLDHYDAIRAQVVQGFTALAKESVQRLRATGVQVEVGLAEQLVAAILDLFPSREDITAIAISYTVGVLQMGSDYYAEQRQALAAKAAAEIAQAEQEAALAAVRAKEKAALSEAWAAAQATAAQAEQLKEKLRMERLAEERILDLKIKAATERFSEAVSPFVEMQEQVLARVEQTAKHILESVQRNDSFPARSTAAARTLRKWLDMMQSGSRSDLVELVQQLDALAGEAGSRSKRDVEAVTETLNQIVDACSQETERLTKNRRLANISL